MTPCSFKDCGSDGKWMPVAVLMAYPRYKAQPVMMNLLNLRVCDRHRESSVVPDFLTRESFERVRAAFLKQGQPPLQWKRTRLLFWDEEQAREVEERSKAAKEAPSET